ncbi:DNA-nicking endonuclease, Smr domain [Enhydrobacter aerosaccus]|uniref:DNA-nicking endonuclease, Smr domain n=1 Tax=Enhydrobacter aerosaccus TaxID=225324 RepID=A0A1T4PVL7_9HYPH|nr:Smr/MutS family protein [Enhydrobacter aerosaccus]SJZ95572.1 DNA-nicking endonuclease, Smr domain [Enhydrobacter aerosaccus]
MAKDVELFRIVMADVTPLRGRRRRKVPVVAPRPVKSGPKAKADILSPDDDGPARQEKDGSAVRRQARLATPESSPEPLAFDRDIDRALSRGRRSPEAILDLHGMTLAAAERAVSRFLEEAHALDLRIVLIVTGKGLRQEGDRLFGGRIRAEFPAWLQRGDNRTRVRGVKAAHPRHGGGGAFYVLLRRRSSASRRSLRATPQR